MRVVAIPYFPLSDSKVLWATRLRSRSRMWTPRPLSQKRRKPVIMSCATCGCLACTISKQSAQLPQKTTSRSRAAALNAKTSQCEWQRRGVECVQEIRCKSATRRTHIRTLGCHGPLRILRSILRGQSSTNHWRVAVQQTICTSTTHGIHSNKKTCSSPFQFNGADLVSTPRLRGGSLDLLL